MRSALERIGVIAALVVLFTAGYIGLGRATDPASAGELGLRLDDAIPFSAATVWIYLWIFPAALIPPFVVSCRRLFRRTALAYAAVMIVSFACFRAYPVSSTRLRAGPELLDIRSASGWAVSVVYATDPPTNLFPSLHLSITVVAAFAAWKASRVYGAASFVGLGLLAVSVCTVKQHFVCDAVGGFLLGLVASTLFITPYSPTPDAPSAYARHGPAAHLAFTACVYSGYLVAYLVR